MPELAPGVIGQLIGRAMVAAQLHTRDGLEDLAYRVAAQARTNASTGHHAHGTPTPARPGTGPAIISGTLVTSITHTPPVTLGTDWMCRVGPQPGRYPPYDHHRRTASSIYGKYLETGLRNGTRYPWLEPAGRIGHVVAPVVFRAAFASRWL